MNSREILRNSREALGLSVHDAASQTGISEPSYWDLETCDDELSQCLSITQAFRICEVLKLHPAIFLSDGPRPESKVTSREVVRQITTFCEKEKISILEFANRAGWDVSAAVARPDSLFSDWNLDCLRDVCSQLGINWLNMLCGLFEAKIEGERSADHK